MKIKKTMLFLLSAALCLIYFYSTPESKAQQISYGATTAPYYITNNFGEDASRELLVQWHNSSSIPLQSLLITSEADESFSNATEIKAYGTGFSLASNLGNFPSRNIFKVHLEDLTPDTGYRYKVGEEGSWSQVFHHKTAGPSTNFSFSVISDPQSESHGLMVDTLNAANAYDENNKFFINAGDLVNDMGERPGEIESYTLAANSINVRTPIATTQGNHDTYGIAGDNVYLYGESTVYNSYLYNPQNGCDPNPARSQSYYFYYNNVLIIMLNSMVDDAQHTVQKQWLQNVLETDRSERLSQYVVVTLHMGLFGNYYYEHYFMTKMRGLYGKILSYYNVDIVLSGHDHSYARTNPIKIGNNGVVDSYEAVENGTVYSIVGTTGPKFYAGTSDVKADTTFAVRSKTNINSGVFVNFKVSDSELTVTARCVNGNLLDNYTIPAKREWSTDPIDNMGVLVEAGISNAEIHLKAEDVEGISKIELQRLDGSIISTITANERQFNLTGLRANSRYNFNVVVYFSEQDPKIFKTSFTTIGLIEVWSGDYIAIVGQHPDAAKYKVYVNGEFLSEHSISVPGCRIRNMEKNGKYLVKVELYNSNGNIIETDHAFLTK